MKPAQILWGIIGTTVLASCFEIAAPDLSQDCGNGAYFGWFRGRATGMISDTLVGCAYFMIDPTTGRFSMVLTDGGPTSVTPRIQMVRAAVPRFPVEAGDEPSQVTVGLFAGTRRFAVTGTLFTTGPEKLKSNEMGFSGKIAFNGVDSVGATLDVNGEFSARCIGTNSSLTPQDQLKPVIPEECRMPDAGIRAGGSLR